MGGRPGGGEGGGGDGGCDKGGYDRGGGLGGGLLVGSATVWRCRGWCAVVCSGRIGQERGEDGTLVTGEGRRGEDGKGEGRREKETGEGRIGDDGIERIWRWSATVEEWREDGREKEVRVEVRRGWDRKGNGGFCCFWEECRSEQWGG